MRTRAVLLVLLTLATVALAGCGKDPAPTAPVARLGPAVEEVYPPARATRVLLGSALWVRFAAPLDPATLTTTNVFLKLDAERIPLALTYDGPARTLRIRPLAALKLRRTYTVELSPRLATADGVALDSTYFWQFTTTTVRALEHPVPASGTTRLSPYAALGWDATESTAGPVRFDVYTGPDSATVAARVAPSFTTSLAYAWTPAPRAFGSTMWWSVSGTNTDTGERIDGPVWRLTTLDAGSPVDSLTLQIASYATVRSSAPNTSNCGAATLVIGSGYNTAVRWNLAALPAGAQVAAARLVLWPFSSPNLGNERSVMYATTTAFAGCSATYPGPPTRDPFYGVLARGRYDAAAGLLILMDERLAGHLECARTAGIPSGYSFMADLPITVYSSSSETRAPSLRVYYYRDPPVGTSAAAAPALHARSPRE